MFDDPNVVLHCEKIDKIYPGTKALDQVSFDLLKGKVNVLIGENGAGKSTLMKMIAGIEQPSAGKMYMDGEEVYFKDTNAARAKGIGIIHQELSLFQNLTVYQNIFMCHEKRKGLFLDDKAHIEGAKQILKHLEHEIPPETLVGDLRVGQQQMVEIARNLVENDLRVLIMDEPTSSLSAAEVKVLFKIMRELLEQGISIVYISHRLEEIMEIGDHVTILRDGKYVADADIKDIDLSWIVENMVGKNTQYHRFQRSIDLDRAERVLEVNHLRLPKTGGGWLLDDVSMYLKKGEVLGIYGLLGAGRSELFECLMGLRPEHTGEITYQGKPMKIGEIADQLNAGFALVPEDRQRQGLVQSLDICKNASLASLETFRRGFLMNYPAEEKAVDEQIRDLQKCLPCEAVIYGRLPLMIIDNRIDAGPFRTLTDRRSECFPVLDVFGGRCEIENAKTLYLGKRSDWQDIGLTYARLRFTTETPEQCAAILRAHRDGTDCAPDDLTRGLFYRGVE